MLRTETVAPATLELLNELMGDDYLGDFFLVGGTALALQIGHRISVDIDLFSLHPFDESKVIDHLVADKGFEIAYKNKNTLKGKINNVQVDLITHGYPWVRPPETIDGIRMTGLEDIAAMKLNAIVGNGTRVKDFLDIAFLSCYLSFEQMIEACIIKYKGINPLMIARSLAHTEDVNQQEPINLVDGRYSWQSIKQRLDAMPDQPGFIFDKAPGK